MSLFFFNSNFSTFFFIMKWQKLAFNPTQKLLEIKQEKCFSSNSRLKEKIQSCPPLVIRQVAVEGGKYCKWPTDLEVNQFDP